ncbi:unnamed protein product [Closterium sp. NIES-65]|nr:unnamed protein product [Closterium sp. NIES-65]
MFRACMQKVPGTVSDGHVGAGVLSATSFGWVAKQIDHLTGEKGRRGVRIESVGMKGMKALRDSMVEYVGKVIAVKRTATPTSQAAGPADSAIDDDGAEGQKAPQGAVAAQHQGNARVHGEGGNGGGGDAEAGAGRLEMEKSSSSSESESEEEDEAVKRKDEEEYEEYEEEEEENKDENGEKWEGGKDEEGGDEEVEFVVEYVEGTVEAGEAEEAVGPADQGNEEEKDDDAGNATRSADVGKEKGEVGVEATTGNGQDEAACEGGGKVSVDAGEGANNTGEQEAGEAPCRQGPELDDVEVDDTDKYAAEQLRNATEAMSKTITGNITSSFDEAWKSMKTFAEHATEWLEDFDNPEGRVAYARALAVSSLAEHVDSVVGDAKKGLEEYISNHLASAQVNIATALTARLAVPPPPPPHPTPPAIPEELLKSFKADILKAVTEATQQSFVASGMKIMTEMIGTVALGRRGSSPSANDADNAQRKTAEKQGHKRTGDGDDKGSSKRSKGAGGSFGSKPAQKSDQLKTKAGWKVVRTSHSKGGGSGGAEGGPADGVAANLAAPTGPPLVAEQTHPQASGGKGVTDKEVPTAQAANDGDSGTAKGPSVAAAAKPASATVAGTTKSSPRNPLAATSAPAGQSGANKDGEAAPAPATPTAAKVVAKVASAKGDAMASAKAPPGGTALREMLRRMEAHSRDVQQHPAVDAGLPGTARRSVTTQVAGKSSGAPPAAPPVAAPPPADPKSDFLRAHLGARKAAAPSVTLPKLGKSATPTSVNATTPTPSASVVDVAAEKGVSAALATGGRADKHANLAVVMAHFEAAKRPEHAPVMAIMDTAHVVPSATHGGGSTEQTAATAAVAEINAGRKEKDDNGKGKAVSQRSTRAMTAGKLTSEEKGKKAEGEKDKTGGKGKPAKKKEKAEEEDEEGGEGDKEHGRRGHGIRRDKAGDGQGWVGEIKVHGQNRYIGKSREKMELAYEHAIAFVVYDGYVSKVLMKELTVLNPGELDKWKEVWAEVKFLPTGMWTVMWARGLCHPRARFDDILDRYRGYASSGVALHDVLWPAIWFPIIEDTEEGKEETNALMSAMVNRVSMCAAYGKVAASAAFGKVDASVEGKADEKMEMGAQALAASACAIWCFLETGASVLGAVGEGKAAAMVAGAGEARAKDFKEVMHAVIDIARSRQAPAGEVAHNVAPSLQSQAVARAFAKGVEEVEADMIARATVETLAFWGMCLVAGPKLKAQGIDVPCDARMEYDMDHRGRKGEKVKQSKGSSKRKKSKQGMGSTDA